MAHLHTPCGHTPCGHTGCCLAKVAESCVQKQLSSFVVFSGAGSGAPAESAGCRAGRGPHPPGEAEGEAEVLRGGLPAGHGAVPVHRLPADRREER